MLRYTDYDIVFREIPDETTLAVNLAGCPNRCPGCHSPQLQEPIGEPLTEEVVERLLVRYGAAVTCFCLMGGDAEPHEAARLALDGANALDADAVTRIFEAKGRPQDNPLIVHVTGPEMLHGLVSEVPERAQLLMAAFCPGPLTIIMPRGPEVAAECCAGLDTVGIRMPSHPVARAVIEKSGCAFAAPSANLSGKPSPTNAQDVFTDMDGRLPLILDGGECDVGVESTVVSVVGEKPTLFRPGHITLEDLERALGEEVEVSKAILEKLPEGAVVRSPGMKYKHYAPKADVTLLDGTFEQFKAYVDAHAEQNPSCLCFTGEAEKLGVPCVEYGREGDGADQAKHIFRCLRALDEQGDAVVYARCPQKDGLSMAVYNRLIRAAAFRVIKL